MANESTLTSTELKAVFRQMDLDEIQRMSKTGEFKLLSFGGKLASEELNLRMAGDLLRRNPELIEQKAQILLNEWEKGSDLALFAVPHPAVFEAMVDSVKESDELGEAYASARAQRLKDLMPGYDPGLFEAYENGLDAQNLIEALEAADFPEEPGQEADGLVNWDEMMKVCEILREQVASGEVIQDMDNSILLHFGDVLDYMGPHGTSFDISAFKEAVHQKMMGEGGLEWNEVRSVYAEALEPKDLSRNDEAAKSNER